MSDAALSASSGASRNGRDRRKTNPHAEWITADELRKLVTGHYGTKTLMFDRELAETLLAYNTGNRKVNERRKNVSVSQPPQVTRWA